MAKLFFKLLPIWLFMISCKKEVYIREPDQAINVTIKTLSPGIMTLNMSYHIDSVVNVSGIIFSIDSFSVSLRNAGATTATSIYLGNGVYESRLDSLTPYSTYWFSVFFEDADGVVHYTALQSFTTREIRFIQRIPQNDASQLYLSEDCGTQACTDVLITAADPVDPALSKYRILFGEQECRFTLNITTSGSSMAIELPRSSQPGIYPLRVYYDNKEVFNNEFNIIRGRFFKEDRHPRYRTTGSFYMYNNRIHSVFTLATGGLAGLSGEYSSWDPVTKQWETTVVDEPPALFYTPSSPIPGKHLNGLIYFTPLALHTRGEAYPIPYYEELLYTLDPVTHTWNRVLLWEAQTPEVTHYKMEVKDTFVHNGRLYCLVYEHKDLGDFQELRIKTYDPASRKWEVFSELNVGERVNYGRILIQGNKLYVLANAVYPPLGGSSPVDYFLYEIDLQTKTVLPKGQVPTYNGGHLDPYFFAYRDRLYVFGGSGTGGLAAKMYEYTIATGTWELLATTYTGGPPELATYQGLCTVINDRIYIAYGYTGTSTGGYIFRFDPQLQ